VLMCYAVKEQCRPSTLPSQPRSMDTVERTGAHTMVGRLAWHAAVLCGLSA